MTKNELILLLAEALTDVCDGVSERYLADMTGLSLERCEEIKDLFYRVFRSYRGHLDIHRLLAEFEVKDVEVLGNVDSN